MSSFITTATMETAKVYAFFQTLNTQFEGRAEMFNRAFGHYKTVDCGTLQNFVSMKFGADNAKPVMNQVLANVNQSWSL